MSTPHSDHEPIPDPPLDVEQAVLERYREGARQQEEDLCCPTEYDERYLEAIPDEIRERDYGCGDPTRHLRTGDTVLDLGSGAGKICYITSQVVGPQGRVIGVDFNDDMLELAEKHRQGIGDAIGWHNVEFRKGRIQDLALDLRRLDAYLAEHPVRASRDLAQLDAHIARLRVDEPLVADGSVDVVVSNCVLNLVHDQNKHKLFSEIFRVLRRGGRIAISDIVSDEEVPARMKQDPELWSGCISGAFREDLFLKAFEDAGFHGIQITSRQEKPWRVVEGIEFRSVTVTAYKGKQGPCWERKQAVVYLGPWREVVDDDGHRLVRGERVAVCDKTYHLLTSEPYTGRVAPIEPYVNIPLEEAKPFACKGYVRRHPKETKGEDYNITTEAAGPCCSPDSNDSDCC
ncbi:MAG: methyltransferase domain-containing protein [Acidobacteriota bacterium]